MTAKSSNQSGNVFFIILIGIVMFAALMFTFSRGVRQSTDGMSGREAELAASDIVNYGQKVQRGVDRILGRSISEADLSFANDTDLNYINPACSGNNCLVFHPDGGAVKWQSPPSNVNYTNARYFIGPNRVGTADGTTKDIGTSARDLVIMLPVNAGVCDAINAITSKQSVWSNGSTGNVSTEFIGNYDAASGSAISKANDAIQPTTGCFCQGSLPCDPATEQLYYYHVLLAR